jgi:hypothetical protein
MQTATDCQAIAHVNGFFMPSNMVPPTQSDGIKATHKRATVDEANAWQLP